jgi:hypothetical protein
VSWHRAVIVDTFATPRRKVKEHMRMMREWVRAYDRGDAATRRNIADIAMEMQSSIDRALHRGEKPAPHMVYLVDALRRRAT